MRSLAVRPSTLDELSELGISYIREQSVPASSIAAGQNVDLTQLMSPVKDQDPGEFCTAFACIGGFEFIVKNGFSGTRPVAAISLSESHIEHAVQKLRGDCHRALSVAEVMFYVNYNGVVQEQDWAYDWRHACNPNPPDLKTKIRYYSDQLAKLAFWRSHEDVQKTIENGATGHSKIDLDSNPLDLIVNNLKIYGAPCVIDLPVFFTQDGMDAGWETGTVHMPTPVQIARWLKTISSTPDSVKGISGWHAVCVVGYELDRKRLIFKNSWGPGWGANGYGTMPFDYVASYTRIVWYLRGGYSTTIGPRPGCI